MVEPCTVSAFAIAGIGFARELEMLSGAVFDLKTERSWGSNDLGGRVLDLDILPQSMPAITFPRPRNSANDRGTGSMGAC